MKIKIYYKAFCIALFLFSISAFNVVKASHSKGADISYRYVGQDANGNYQYRVTLSFYRDCAGATDPGGCNYTFDSNCNVSGSSCQAPGTIYFYMMSKNCGYCIKDQFDPVTNLISKKEVTPICPNQTTTCAGGTNPGVEVWELAKTVTLPAQCTDWRFVYGSFARNSSITTLNQTSVGIYVEATLNSVAAPTNSSPKFSVPPVPFLCAGQQFCYNHGAYEPNGDSIVYTMNPPARDISGGSVSYKTGFTYDQPVTTTPPGNLTIDPKTGNVCFTPAVAEVTVMAVKVTEYKNGVVVGTTIRDIQVNILNCTNNPPVVSGITNLTGGTSTTNNFTVDSVCAGTPMCFDVTGSDADGGQNVIMAWNNSIPGASFNVTGSGTPSPKGTFCWTPTASDVRVQPYTFVVTVEDDHCPYTATQALAYSIYVKSCGITVVASTNSPICNGDTTTVSALAQGGQPGYTYSWSPSGLGGVNTGASMQVAPTSNTWYYVTATDQNNNTNRDSIRVVVRPLPTPDAGTTVAICQGGSTKLTATCAGCNTPLTYTWIPSGSLVSPTTDTTTASPNNTRLYTVTITDANSCSAFDTVTVQVNPLPTIDAGLSQTICPNTSAVLTANGGGVNGTYTWTSDPTLTCTGGGNICQSPTVNPASGTVWYYVVGTDVNGCTGKDSVDVTVSAQLTVDASAPEMCEGSQSQITTITSATTFNWSPTNDLNCTNCQNPVATPSVTTIYTVTGTSNGCTGTDTVQVIVNQRPTANAGIPTSVCPGGSTTLNASGNGGTPGYNFSWSPDPSLTPLNVPNPTASPTVNPTTYTVIVTDAKNCQDTATVGISIFNSPPVDAGQTVAICIGTSATLTATGADTYVWNPTGTCGGAGCQNLTVSPAGTTLYSVTGTDVNMCTATDTVTVEVGSTLSADGGPAQDLCNGSQTNLSVVSPGATTYTWSPINGLGCPTCQTTTANPTTTTTYTIDVANGLCTGTDTVTIFVHQIPPADGGPAAAICQGSSTTLTASGGGTYTWNPTTGLSNINSATPNANPSQSTLYSVTVSNGYCTATDTVSVTVNALPTVGAGPTSTICNGTCVQLQATGALNYNWNPSTGLSNPTIDQPNACPNATTTYNVVGTDVNSCSGSASVTITIVPAPIPIPAQTRDICEGQSITLTANGGTIYSWSPATGLNSTTIPNPVAAPLTSTTYVVEVSTGGTCPNVFDTVNVTVHPAPPIDAGIDTTVMSGTEVQLGATGGGLNYQWYPTNGLSCINCQSPVALPLYTTTYIVTTIDAFGCRNRDTVTVNVEDIVTLYVPNAFSPKGVGDYNHMFYAFGVGIHNFEFYIYNRWGQKVFSTTDPSEGWDGSYDGRLVQDDVYVFYAKAKSYQGKSITRTGSITIVR